MSHDAICPRHSTTAYKSPSYSQQGHQGHREEEKAPHRPHHPTPQGLTPLPGGHARRPPLPRTHDDGRRVRAVELQLVLPLQLGADSQALSLSSPLLRRGIVISGIELSRQRDELVGAIYLNRARGRPGRHFVQPSLGSSAQPRRAGPPLGAGAAPVAIRGPRSMLPPAGSAGLPCGVLRLYASGCPKMSCLCYSGKHKGC